MKIAAAVMRAVRSPLTLESLQLDEPQADEVLVRVVATGICHTDIVARDGGLPTPPSMVLGHEGAGIVERIGDNVGTLRPGQRVIMSFDSCGHCACCQDGTPAYCHAFVPYNFLGRRRDGSVALKDGDGQSVHGHFFGQSSFATHALCHERNLVPVTEDVPLEVLAPLGCGLQTGAGAVLNVLKVRPGDSIVVFGVGAVGLAAVMAARWCGASQIFAVDRNQQRLALATELGATAVFEASADVAAAIVQASGNGVDHAVDTTGVPSVTQQVPLCLAPRGCCVFLGAYPPDAMVQLNPTQLLLGGRSVRGLVEGDSNPARFIPRLIAGYRSGHFPIDKLLSFYSFDQINTAISDAEAGRVVKPVLRMETMVHAGGAT